MPLRDHFRPPMSNIASWEEVHGMWPSIIAIRLNDLLPPDFRSGVKIHLGSLVEVDVGTFERENAGQVDAPTLLLDTDELTPPEYEVRVYDVSESRRLVAAVEIVSPRNKDRADARDAFVSKCHALLQEQVCVVIVDPVTVRGANLYADLARRIGTAPPATADASIYAVCCRPLTGGGRHRVEAWEHALAVNAPLPTLPLWISESRYVPLELERTYEDTCRGLRIA